MIVKQLRDEISQAEKAELAQWINESDANRALYDELCDFKKLEPLLKDNYQSRLLVEKKIKERIAPEEVRIFTWKWAVAAAILAFIITTGWYLLSSKPQQPLISVENKIDNIVAPHKNRATITLANGQTVYFDQLDSGQLLLQGGTQLIKLADGKLAYQSANNAEPHKETFNTLTNPSGSTVIGMLFSDGSHVWLNAGSSITFPVVFTGKERKVKLIGEAYFEVAKNAVKKFYVETESLDVEVHGTHFNVNAYSNEPGTKVTLLEGSVTVNTTSQQHLPASSRKLQPGQQAFFNSRHAVEKIKISNANIDEVMAWKNGVFYFEAEDMASIARELAIWYNTAIEYKGAGNKKITGYISRSSKLTEVLEMLAYTAGIKYKSEKERIVLQ